MSTVRISEQYTYLMEKFAPEHARQIRVEELAKRSVAAQRKRRLSSKAIGGRDPSLRWPHLYEILLSKGYSKEKAAMISNSRLKYRKKGRLILKSERRKVTASAEVLSPAQAWMEQFHGNHNQKSHGRRGGARGTFPEIGAEGVRGDSRPVSSAEFQNLANEGQDQLDRMAGNTAPAKGLDDNWSSIQANGFEQVQSEWGGNTYNARNGEVATEGLALTIKDSGVKTVSIPIGSDKATFDAAMTEARGKFDSILQREGSHLGVFRDDDVGRIDFDPVLVVQTIREVETIGAATLAIGGAYEFSTGNGRWPPHVAEGA